MEKRLFAPLQREISLLGFGCMRFPRPDQTQPKIDVAEAEKMLDYAYAHGVNYFDTAYMYHGGESEIVVGNALKKYPRDSFLLADKMPLWDVTSTADIERIFNDQLKKCQVDYFDFYLIHAMSAEFLEKCKKYAVYEFLARMKNEGKIRALGFSFHDNAELVETICSWQKFDFAQIQLNYMDWDLYSAHRQYEILCAHAIPVIVMEPVRGGTLAALDGHAAQVLKTANPQASLASWALRFAGSLPNVLTVLSGMSTQEQVVENVDLFTHFEPLTPPEHEAINAAVKAYFSAGSVPCTGCRYCMPCPQQVDIPRMFSVYNHYTISRSTFDYTNMYTSTRASGRAHLCVQCGACMKKCPQKIDIPHYLNLADEAFKLFTNPQFEAALVKIRKENQRCALFKDEGVIFTSEKQGVGGLLEAYTQHPELLEKAGVVDKVIGRAAAVVLIAGKAKEVWGEIMSKAAYTLLMDNGVYAHYGKLVDAVLNRDKTGLCPLEKALSEVDNVPEALQKLLDRVTNSN